MKKIFLYCCTLLISGCTLLDLGQQSDTHLEDRIISENSSVENKTENTTSEIISAEGVIIENKEKSFFETGTHLLQDGNTTLFVLESEFDNLSDFVGEGRVIVEGEKANLENIKVPLLRVHTVHFIKTPKSYTSTLFNSEDFGISFILPPQWVYEEEESQKINFYIHQQATSSAMSLERFPLSGEAAGKTTAEIENGTEISIGNRRAFRFIPESGIRTDIFAILDTFILKISFLGENEEDKAAFYDILLSVKFTGIHAPPETELEVCGGIAGFTCPIGYRCELEGEYPDASGVCTPIDTPEFSDAGENIPPAEKKIRSPDEEAAGTPKEVSVTTPDDSDTGDEETQPEQTDSDTSSQTQNAGEQVSDTSLEQAPEASEGYRLYESTHYAFSVEYPKNGYYAHLGSINGTISTVVFSDEEANEENALFRIEILDGTREKHIESDTEIILSRDDITHFRLTTVSNILSPDLTHMANTLTSFL